MVPDTDNPECRRKSELNLAGFLAKSAVNGPGIRAVIWVQGCPIRCNGCFNPELLPFSKLHPVPVQKLAKAILALDNIDGVTFSGGEPFAQAAPLAELGSTLQSKGLSIVTFTGFTWEQLASKNRPAWQRLLSITDLLFAGPYLPEKNASLNRLADSNRKSIHRICGGRPVNQQIWNSSVNADTRNEIEFTLLPDGRTVVTGYPGSRLVRELAQYSSGV
jgi:anaerobic ribonucleoside-triphosphate reductase activating protein